MVQNKRTLAQPRAFQVSACVFCGEDVAGGLRSDASPAFRCVESGVVPDVVEGTVSARLLQHVLGHYLYLRSTRNLKFSRTAKAPDKFDSYSLEAQRPASHDWPTRLERSSFQLFLHGWGLASKSSSCVCGMRSLAPDATLTRAPMLQARTPSR